MNAKVGEAKTVADSQTLRKLTIRMPNTQSTDKTTAYGAMMG